MIQNGLQVLFLIESEYTHWELKKEKQSPKVNNFHHQPLVSIRLTCLAGSSSAAEENNHNVNEGSNAVQRWYGWQIPHLHEVDSNASHSQQNSRANPLNNMKNACKFNSKVHYCRGLFTDHHSAIQTNARRLTICIGIEVTCANTADELHYVIEANATAKLQEFFIHQLCHNWRWEVM